MPFVNKIRLPIKISKPSFPSERNVFARADGTTILLSATIRKLFQGETDFFPESWHEKLAIALSHDQFFYSDQFHERRFVQDGEYEIQWPEFLDYPLAKAAFTLRQSEFESVNSSCPGCSTEGAITWRGIDPYCQLTAGCASGALSPDGSTCTLDTSTPATILQPSSCFADAISTDFGNFEARVYKVGFSQSSLSSLMVPDTEIDARMTTSPMWIAAPGQFNGAANRCGVYLDSNCDGITDAPGGTLKPIIDCKFLNGGAARIIYCGCFAGAFRLIVNGVVVGSASSGYTDARHRVFHIIPVTVQPGYNYINLEIFAPTGMPVSGGGLTVYDNTAAQIAAATADSQLNIFCSSSFLKFSGPLTVASCPVGQSLFDGSTAIPTCHALSFSTPATGTSNMKAFANRERLVFGAPDGYTEPNVPDENYVEPVEDLTFCP